jgi:hypothetical protein
VIIIILSYSFLQVSRSPDLCWGCVAVKHFYVGLCHFRRIWASMVLAHEGQINECDYFILFHVKKYWKDDFADKS